MTTHDVNSCTCSQCVDARRVSREAARLLGPVVGEYILSKGLLHGFAQALLDNLNRGIAEAMRTPPDGVGEETLNRDIPVDSSEGHNPEPTNVVGFESKLDRDSLKCLACGGIWFNLVSAGDREPAVCADFQGVITGYHGTFECRECGQAIA